MLPAYWATSTVARYNWVFSGFNARLDRLTQAVVFTRR
jgi:hypothetical protein